MATTIPIKCIGAESLPLDRLTRLQGDLKELSKKNLEKLKTDILEDGFCFPFVVWKDGETNWIVDGHQRDFVLRELAKDKEVILPESYPVVYIKANDKTHAAKLLLKASSQFGTITEEGLYDFMEQNNIEIEELVPRVEFDAINIEDMEKKMEDEEAMGGGEPSVQFSEELNEENNYIVLFTDNQTDWNQIQTIFEVPQVMLKRNNGTFWSKGVGRVIAWTNALEKIKKNLPT